MPAIDEWNTKKLWYDPTTFTTRVVSDMDLMEMPVAIGKSEFQTQVRLHAIGRDELYNRNTNLLLLIEEQRQ